jgi:uncharacterized membrane protein required for colicin V production
MKGVPFADLVVGAVLAIAVLRGIWIGLIREGFSIVAIAIAAIVTRLAIDPVAAGISQMTSGEVTGRTAFWIAGCVLVVGSILVVGTLARFLRRGAHFAGLGWADRLGGGALGLAEGTVVSTILILIALWLVGPKHSTLAGSRSLAAYEQIQSFDGVEDLKRIGQDLELPDVAAPGADSSTH